MKPTLPSTSRCILVAVTGSSPAVLTETLWALSQETPPVIPDLVRVVTTTRGASDLQLHLLAPRADWKGLTVWQALRVELLGESAGKDPRLTLDKPMVISLPDPSSGTTRLLDDIRSPSDNSAAAEAILATVRGFTSDSDNHVLGLLAGGRKTMAALLHAAFSLAGRPSDRLLHVLVNEPFDSPDLSPLFYFPSQPGPRTHLTPAGGKVSRSKAKIEIADVPLVGLGELVSRYTGNLPATFSALSRVADQALQEAQSAVVPIRLRFESRSLRLRVNGYTVSLPKGRASSLCRYLCDQALADAELLDRQSLADRMESQKIRYTDPSGIAMSFLVLGMATEAPIAVEDAGPIATSFPGFAELMNALGARLPRAPIGLNREGVVVET